MALGFERTEVSLKEVGTKATVPNDPKAELMYYLSCVASVLDLKADLPRKFLNYSDYKSLSSTDIAALLLMCKLLSPSVLTDKCIFENESIDGLNKFLELSAAKSSMVATQGIVIGGRRVQLVQIMVYKRDWRRRYYDEPFAKLMAQHGSKVRSLEASTSGRSGSSCIIL